MPQSPLFAEARPANADAALLSRARNSRDRAEEALTRAEMFHDPEAKRMMRDIAWSYEKLARRLEKEFGAGRRGVV